MRYIVIKKDQFKGKRNGVEYVNLHCLGADGKVDAVMTTLEKYNSFNVDETRFMSAEELAKFFKNFDFIDIQFDRKGFLSSIQ